MSFSMTTKKTTKKTKENSENRISKKENISEVIVEKKISNDTDTNVSVFTKTTNPKVVIKSEKVDNTTFSQDQNTYRHRFLKSFCLIIMGIIILMTFFLTLKTYNTINELSLLLSN